MPVQPIVRSIVRPTVTGIVRSFGSSFVSRFGTGLSAAYFLADLGSKRGTVDGVLNPVVRVRRDSDGGLRAFTANDITTGVLLAWVGTGGSDNGQIAKWYDGSGNHRDATQGTVNDMPKIVNAGAMVVDANGNASIDFAGNEFLSANSLVTIASGTDLPVSAFSIAEPVNVSASNSALFSFGNHSNNTPLRWTGIADGDYVLQERDDGNTIATISGGTVQTGVNLITSIANGNTRTIYGQGAQAATNSVNLGATTLTRFSIGALIRATPGLFFSGKIAGQFFYGAEKYSDRPAIETALAKEFNITLA
jgi:hypothetical protein